MPAVHAGAGHQEKKDRKTYLIKQTYAKSICLQPSLIDSPQHLEACLSNSLHAHGTGSLRSWLANCSCCTQCCSVGGIASIFSLILSQFQPRDLPKQIEPYDLAWELWRVSFLPFVAAHLCRYDHERCTPPMLRSGEKSAWHANATSVVGVRKTFTVYMQSAKRKSTSALWSRDSCCPRSAKTLTCQKW